jgi:hypothetical protein
MCSEWYKSDGYPSIYRNGRYMKVFLFAHQDDEIFALPYILNSDKKLFIYLTNGVSTIAGDMELRVRTLEAKEVFETHLAGINSEVIWWGFDKSIPEGELYKFVNKESILQIVKVIGDQEFTTLQLVTTTFEGAHQDHDASAVIAREIGEFLGVKVIEVSTYPQWFSKFYSFKVMKPHQLNESVEFSRVKVLFLAIKLIKSYKTQRMTWLGLAVATITSYAFRTYHSAIPMEVSHLNQCFYETRGRSQQTDVLKHLNVPIF